LPTFCPVGHIVSTIFPIDCMGVVVDYGYAPRDDDVVADSNSSIANKIAAANKTSISDRKHAAPFFESDVGVDDRVASDLKLIARDITNATPLQLGCISD